MAMVEAAVEGTIDTITSDGSGGVIITAMTAAAAKKVTVLYSPGDVIKFPRVPVGTKVRQKSIRTPGQRLTVGQLLDPTPFPGRAPQKGFEGGTIIAEGFFDTTAGKNVFHANHVTVEPAETVLAGAITGNDGTTVSLNTLDLELLTDSRLSTDPNETILNAPGRAVFFNDSGFEITINSIQPDSVVPQDPNAQELPPSTAEGYFAGGKFHTFRFDYSTPGLLSPLPAPFPIDYPRISIERAQVREGDLSFDLEIRGHISTPPLFPQATHVLEFHVLDMKPGTFGVLKTDWELRGGSDASSNITDQGTVRIVIRTAGGNPIQQVPPIQRWRFRGNLPKSGVHLLPPERIQVRNLTAENFLKSTTDPVLAALPVKEVRKVLDTDVRVD